MAKPQQFIKELKVKRAGACSQSEVMIEKEKVWQLHGMVSSTRGACFALKNDRGGSVC